MVFPSASNSSFTALAELTDETELVPSAMMIAGDAAMVVDDDDNGVVAVVCMPVLPKQEGGEGVAVVVAAIMVGCF